MAHDTDATTSERKQARLTANQTRIVDNELIGHYGFTSRTDVVQTAVQRLIDDIRAGRYKER